MKRHSIFSARRYMPLFWPAPCLEPPGQRIFTDDDVPELTEAYSPVHDRLVAMALELSGVALETDPVDTVETAKGGTMGVGVSADPGPPFGQNTSGNM